MLLVHHLQCCFGSIDELWFKPDVCNWMIDIIVVTLYNRCYILSGVKQMVLNGTLSNPRHQLRVLPLKLTMCVVGTLL